MSGGYLARGVIVQRVYVRGYMSGGYLSGGICPGGICPRTVCTIYISKLISLGDIISYLYYKPVCYCIPSCVEMTCIIVLLCWII